MEALPLWMHTIDLGGGVVTPGAWTPEDQAGTLGALEQIDFRGKKVLDVGCLDGLWSFEAERRGAAEVYATDLVSQVTPNREPYFRLAHELLGSRARYVPDLSVFDVARLGVRDFDVVLYLGVYYHLRDPLLSFARLRQVMRTGAVLLVEGQVIDAPEASPGSSIESTTWVTDRIGGFPQSRASESGSSPRFSRSRRSTGRRISTCRSSNRQGEWCCARVRSSAPIRTSRSLNVSSSGSTSIGTGRR